MSSNVLFRKRDVSKWHEMVSFFEDTYSTLGPIDAVISNVAINIVEPFTAETSTLEPPDLSVLDVNLVGTWYVTNCAVHYFKRHPADKPSQLVLFGSVASYFDTPPLYTYCASKGGVLGLMRGLRTQLPKDNITVNMIDPWMTSKSCLSSRLYAGINDVLQLLLCLRTKSKRCERTCQRTSHWMLPGLLYYRW